MSFLKVSIDVSSIQFRFSPDVSKWYINIDGKAMCHFDSFIGAYRKSYFKSLEGAVANAKEIGVLPESFKAEDLPLPKVKTKLERKLWKS